MPPLPGSTLAGIFDPHPATSPDLGPLGITGSSHLPSPFSPQSKEMAPLHEPPPWPGRWGHQCHKTEGSHGDYSFLVSSRIPNTSSIRAWRLSGGRSLGWVVCFSL